MPLPPSIAAVAIQTNSLAEALEAAAAHSPQLRMLLTALNCQGVKEGEGGEGEACGLPVPPDAAHTCTGCRHPVGAEVVKDYRVVKETVEALLRHKQMPPGVATEFMGPVAKLSHPLNLVRARLTEAVITSSLLQGKLEDGLRWGRALEAAALRGGVPPTSLALAELAARLRAVAEAAHVQAGGGVLPAPPQATPALALTTVLHATAAASPGAGGAGAAAAGARECMDGWTFTLDGRQ